MGTWTIRSGLEADIPSLLELWRQAGGPATATDDEGGLRELLARDPEALLVAEAGDGLIGSLIVGWMDGEAASTGSRSTRVGGAGAWRRRFSAPERRG